MKKRSLRVLSLLVAIVMAISLLPLAALAEETGPKRQAGVVVYGAELTVLLTDMESTINELQSGDVDISRTVDRLNDLVKDIGTKVVDGSGISVPDVDVVITNKDTGKEYTLKEDTNIEIFTETTEMYVPFQNAMEQKIREIQAQLDDLKVVMTNHGLGDMVTEIDSANQQFTDILKKIQTLSTDLIADLTKLTGMNGMLYRTYVTDEAIPVGDYTVTVKGFYDTDKDGNALIRDGYILYNDGLEEGGSGFNTYRTFETTIKEQGMFDHAIQFVGPENGIQGQIELPEALATVYDTTATALNTLAGTLDGINKKLSGQDDSSIIGSLVNKVTNLVANVTNTQDLLEWFGNWNTDLIKLPTSDKLDLQYKFTFPGLWCAESDAGFSFTNVDVAEAGITGSSFLLVNRAELIDVLKLMLDLGKEVVTAILKATFGYTDEESGKTYDSMLSLYTQLLKTEDGQITIDYDIAYEIVKTYIAVISDMDIIDKVVDTDTGDILTPVKLRYPIPAILEATSDENGVVTFTKNSNVTLTWMLEIIPQVTEALSKTDLVNDNKLLNLLIEVTDYAANVIAKYGSKIINTLVYPFAQRLGFVGKKLASGEYIMFQIKTPDDYYVNPLAYTMILTWDNDTWLYVTVADLGLIGPYLADGFYDFVRETTIAGTVDKFLSQLADKDVDFVTKALNGDIDVTAAFTAYIATVAYDSLGLDTVFTSKLSFLENLNAYLIDNGRTTQNLLVYVNKQAKKAKAVYAGYVNEDWYFYNVDKSPTLTATKLIDKSTADIAAAFVSETKASAVTSAGTAVSNVVNSVGTKVEAAVDSVKTQVKSTIGTAVQSAVQKVTTKVKTTATTFLKNLFNRGAITFNA